MEESPDHNVFPSASSVKSPRSCGGSIRRLWGGAWAWARSFGLIDRGSAETIRSIVPRKCGFGNRAKPLAQRARRRDMEQKQGTERSLAPQLGPDLEVKDAQLIFRSVWKDLEEEYGLERLRFPKEIILLGGAPGAGKGTHTRFILKARGLTCDSIVVSSLLDSPEARAIKAQGGIVGDREVVGIVFRKLLDEEYRDGAVLDGFPRTKTQVECVKLLVSKMRELRKRFFETELRAEFRSPTVHIMVLFVDELTSIERQLRRGRELLAHNERVRVTGVGELEEVRETDLVEEKAKRRYQVFKEKTWSALQSLKETFFYHFIDAEGSVGEVEENIKRELQYQSTLELDPQTYDYLRSLPLASDLVIHARQELVRRLDNYATHQSDLLRKVVDFIETKVMPIVSRHAIPGVAIVNSEEPLLNDPAALAMLIDIFSERGYRAIVDLHRIEVPRRINWFTGKVTTREKKVFRIQIHFQGSAIRRGA